MSFAYLAFRQHLLHGYLRQFADLRAEYSLTQMEIELLLFLWEHPAMDTASAFINWSGTPKVTDFRDGGTSGSKRDSVQAAGF